MLVFKSLKQILKFWKMRSQNKIKFDVWLRKPLRVNAPLVLYVLFARVNIAGA